MRFLWPPLLLLLVLVPLAALGYWWLLRRRASTAIRVASLGLIREAGRHRPRWRRHLPFALWLTGLAAALLACARPQAVLSVPALDRTVILAFDVSGSMRAKDIAPSRIAAAQAAARDFIDGLPGTTRVGIVSFAASASVAQAPTTDRDDLLSAIDRFQLQKGTAAGTAILVSLQLILPDFEYDLQSPDLRKRPRPGGQEPAAGGAARPAVEPVEPGSHKGATIILLTDGQSNIGADPIAAARLAAERGVRVHTVGVGTPAGELLSTEGWSMRVRLDEAPLRQLADLTRGSYVPAADASALREAYRGLASRLAFERRETEVSAIFAGVAVLCFLLGAGLSAWWLGRWR
ncbi:MAG: VWA domain-containing protein [Betaproteobacteria bacterium]|nr:VWA domain-containing protein [Betaproteobacteria bacterium]